MSALFSGNSVSIVILPDSKLLQEIEPLIREWLTERLLSPLILITPEGVVEKPGEPPIVFARVINCDNSGFIEEITEDIFKILAEREFSLVRLIALRTLSKNVRNVGEHNDTLEKIVKYIVNSLPQPSALENEIRVGTRLLRINLVVAPSELHSSNFQEVFEGPWDMHVVASPEDRSSPWSGDAYIRDDVRFRKFALMHLASTAGLWSGLNASAFELVSREKATGGSIWMSRVFVSSILTEGLSRRIAAKAVNSIANSSTDLFESKVGIYVSGTELISDDLVDSYVDWMVAQVFSFEEEALRFQHPDEGESPSKERWYEWTQIKHFFIFAWDKLKVIPWWIWIWIRRSVGRSLERTFQGDDGLAEIGISRDEPMDNRDKILAMKLLDIKDATSLAKRALVSPLQRKSVRTTPKLWADIRRIVFGMLDGSDLSDMGLNPTEGRVPVFSGTSQVIQDPNDTFIIPEQFRNDLKVEEINWKNLDSAKDILQRYDDNINRIKQEQNSTLDEIVKLDDEIEQARWEKR